MPDEVAKTVASSTAVSDPVPNPLHTPIFRNLWLASVASSIGSAMHDTAAVWTMTSLTTSPTLISLMQTAASLPFFLLVLPAGALADVVDRRRLLLFVQAWMCMVALTLSGVMWAGWATPWLLLALTFALAMGVSVNQPTWMALMPETVSKAQMPAAVMLGGVSINISRAVGPAIAGVLLSVTGPAAVFALNALSFLAVMSVIFRWKRPAQLPTAQAERFVGALVAAVRYVHYSAEVQTVLLHNVAFVFCAAAVTTLLPILARQELHLTASQFGLLLTAYGTGAVFTAIVLLPRLRGRCSTDTLVAGATLVAAGVAAGIAFLRHPAVLGVLLFVGGGAWLAAISSLNIAAQSVFPAWVRGRVNAVYLLVMQGGLAFGGLFWGQVTGRFGLRAALLGAGGALIVGWLLTLRFRMGSFADMNLEPSHFWPGTVVTIEPAPDEGPVLVLIEYQIEPASAAEFLAAMHYLRATRLRDGGQRWELLEDLAAPGSYRETFLVGSWSEHLRQHERATVADQAVEERVLAFHLGPGQPRVSHFLVCRTGKRSQPPGPSSTI